MSMYNEESPYASFNVSGNDALLGSPTSSSSSSSSSLYSARYRLWFVKYRKPLAFVAAFVILAFVIGLIAVVSRPKEDGGEGGGGDEEASSSSSAPPAAPTAAPATSTPLPPLSLSSLPSSSASPLPPTASATSAFPATSASSSSGGGGSGPPIPAGRLFGFAEAFSRNLTLSYSSLSWSPFDASYVTTRGRAIVRGFPGGSGEEELIPASLLPSGYSLVSFTTDYSFFLFRSSFQALYRHSGVALYHYVDRTQSPMRLQPLSPYPLQYAQLSPSLTAPAIAYVRSNNLYLFDLTTIALTQVTADGEYGRVINGVCDWAYEEEVYSRTGVLWFSPSGRHLAFLRFNETLVPEYTFPLYYLPRNNVYAYKYPKVNDTNSVVSVGLYNTASNRTYIVDVGGEREDQYVINAAWLGDDTLAVKVMPRVQNRAELFAIDAEVPDDRLRRLSQQSHPFYLEADFVLRYLPSLGGYIDTVIVNDHNHVGLWIENGRFARYLTSSAEWGVEAVHCFEPQSGFLYVTASWPSSIERSLLAVDVRSGEWTPVLPTPSPTWQAASFSGNCTYFTLSEQANPSLLDTRVFLIDPANAPNVSYISTLSDNAATLSLINSYNLPTQAFTTFPSKTAPQFDLNAYFLLPPTFQGSLEQPDCSYRYPVIINVYGGPGNQMVSARYGRGGNAGGGFATFLSGSKGYVSFTVDPIGTGGQGDTFRKNYTTFQLWQQEEVDLKAVIDSLSSLCFIDAERIAYWGWSYGGSMATRIATSPLPGKVNTVLAVAPVTDWRLYDSIYTERYMRRPTDNPAGYARTTLLTERAKQLTVSSYMLIHGTADDNVHWQNAALLMEQLAKNGQPFAQFHYTNANHGMTDFSTRLSYTSHLYQMIYLYFSGMVYGRGGDPRGVLTGEEEARGMMAMQHIDDADWQAEETLSMLHERFFMP